MAVDPIRPIPPRTDLAPAERVHRLSPVERDAGRREREERRRKRQEHDPEPPADDTGGGLDIRV